MKNEISYHLVTSRENLSLKILRGVPCLRAHYIFILNMQLRKLLAHLTSICFSFPGSEASPILLKFLRFSAQISGFSADFHRKSLDIVK